MSEENNGYWVVLSNSGGELARKFARTEPQARDRALELIRSVPALYDGDTINVVEGWSEHP